MKSSNQAAPIHVLLVEDNPGDTRLVREYLKEAKQETFRLLDVKTIRDALEALRANKPDVILLDLSLPDASGTEGYTRLANAAPGVPIIVLTGVGDAEMEKRLMSLGTRDYLRKSHFDGALLASVLRNWVSFARSFMSGEAKSDARSKPAGFY